MATDTATVPSINSCYILSLSHVLIDIRHAIGLHVTLPITIGNVPFQGGEFESVMVGSSSIYPVTQNLPSAPTVPYPLPSIDPYLYPRSC